MSGKPENFVKPSVFKIKIRSPEFKRGVPEIKAGS
jgi:hypothetical protein